MSTPSTKISTVSGATEKLLNDTEISAIFPIFTFVISDEILISCSSSYFYLSGDRWLRSTTTFVIHLISSEWAFPKPSHLQNYAESVGVDPNTIPGTTCFQDKLAGRCNSPSKPLFIIKVIYDFQIFFSKNMFGRISFSFIKI